MSDQTQFPNPSPAPAPQEPQEPLSRRERRRLRRGAGSMVWGAILIAIGLVALAQQIFHFEVGLLFLPALALVFLVAGIVGRRPGFLVPGGILAGIGVGAILMQGPFSYMEDPARGGIFLLSFAGGWLLITLLAPLADCIMLWPLIPAAFMGVIGLGLVAGQAGLQILQWAGVGWPVILIALGLYLVFRRRELRK
jgi:hypothetical protein